MNRQFVRAHLIALALAVAPTWSAANIVVTDGNVAASSTTCTLAQAIYAANLANNPADATPSGATTVNPLSDSVATTIGVGTCSGAVAGPNTISLANYAGQTLVFSTADNYWYGPNALPPIASDIEIDGYDVMLQVASGTTRLRLFFIGADPNSTYTPGYNTPGPGHLFLHNLTLSGGVQLGGTGGPSSGSGAGLGGAIYNQGQLDLSAVTLTGNRAIGGSSSGSGLLGGGGGLGADASAFSGSSSGGGMGGPVPSGTGEAGQNANANGLSPGSGGGPDTGTGGDGGWAAPGFGGGDGSGGAGIGESTGSGDGGGGGGFGGGGGGTTGGGGFGAGGGSIYGSGGGVGGGGGSGTSGIAAAGGGGFGGGGGSPGVAASSDAGRGGFGGGGGAGGQYNADFTSGHPAVGGFGGGAGAVSGVGNGGGGAGMGGAIFNHSGVISLINCTLTGNQAVAGSGAVSGQGLGGAIFNLNGDVSISFSTLAGNAASTDGGALYSLGYNAIASGAGSTTASVVLSNNILSGSVQPGTSTSIHDLVNNRPAFVADGVHANVATSSVANGAATPANLVMSATSVAGAAPLPAFELSGDPQLGALGVVVGFPGTMALPPYSNAATAGTCNDVNGLAVTVDERNAARPAQHCDLGAYNQNDRIFYSEFEWL